MCILFPSTYIQLQGFSTFLWLFRNHYTMGQRRDFSKFCKLFENKLTVLITALWRGHADCCPEMEFMKVQLVEVSGNNLELSQTWGFYLLFCLSTNAIHEQTWVFFTNFFYRCLKPKGWFRFLLGFPHFGAFLIIVSKGENIFMYK